MVESGQKPLFRLKEGIRLVLGSGSPRRQQFLAEWGVPFAVRPAKAEPEPMADELPTSYVLRSADEKLASAGWAAPELVIAADTIVTREHAILGKPADDAEALSMLSSLAGRTHAVMTAVSLRFPDGGSEHFVDTSRVTFHPWEEAFLRAYVGTGECRDKAGAYAVQGQGAFLVSAIEGSWSTVVGLPVSRLAALLVKRGFFLPA